MANIATFEVQERLDDALGVTRGVAERMVHAAAVLSEDDVIAYGCRLLAQAIPIERCEISEAPEPSALGARHAPLTAHGRVVGVLSLLPRNADVEFSLDEEEALAAVGTVLGLVLSGRDTRQAISAERERIAHDLHDSVGQLLTGIGLRLTECLAEDADDRRRVRLQEVLDSTKRASLELRDAIHGLLTFHLSAVGLADAVSELCRSFEQTTTVAAVCNVHGTPTPLSATAHEALLRVAREALKNIELHANATTAIVELSYANSEVSLRVEDDGVGLTGHNALDRHGHFGIHTIRRRIEDEGGHLNVRHARPHGVVVEAVIPDRGEATDGTGSRGGGR